MGELPVVLSSLALQDLSDLVDYASRDNPEAANRLVETIEQRIELLSSYPGMGKIWRGRYRILIVEKYLVFYVVTDQQVQIRRVVHGARGLEHLLDS